MLLHSTAYHFLPPIFQNRELISAKIRALMGFKAEDIWTEYLKHCCDGLPEEILHVQADEEHRTIEGRNWEQLLTAAQSKALPTTQAPTTLLHKYS